MAEVRRVFGNMSSGRGGFKKVFFIMQKEGFMINDFVEEFFKWNHGVPSPHSCDQLVQAHELCRQASLHRLGHHQEQLAHLQSA